MIKGRINVYLAGVMSYYKDTGQYEKAIDWRQGLINYLLDYNQNVGYWHFGYFDPTENSLENFKTANNKTVLYQNNHYLDKCDILVVNLDDVEKSPGTIYEIYYFGIHNKPVIAIGEHEWADSPHIAESITVALSSSSDTIDYLDSYYGQ